MAGAQRDPLAERIISVLHSGERQDLVILIIPSHKKDGKPIQNQAWWAGAAMDRIAELYRGGTAFETFLGIYKTSDGKILRDKPILIESYVQRADLEDMAKLRELLEFARRMGRETQQAAVGLIINDVFHEIADF